MSRLENLVTELAVILRDQADVHLDEGTGFILKHYEFASADPAIVALLNAIEKESFRGGYTKQERGRILEKMFNTLERSN